MDHDTSYPRAQHDGDTGASLVEYALLVALIALIALSALAYFGREVGGSLDRSGQSIVAATG